MAEAEAEKRKEPAASTDAAEPAKAEPPAKRPKASTSSPAVIRKQVEYYLSDENLRHDKFFHEKISSDPEGWLDMTLILSCNKMKAMKASREDVVAALEGSKLEIKDGGAAVRRPGNVALPALEAKPVHQSKKTLHAHDGGVVSVFKGVPAEVKWGEIKELVQAKLPEKVALWHVNEITDARHCALVCQPFEGDLKFFEELEIEVGGSKLKSEIVYGEPLQQILKTVPKPVRDKRDREMKKRQKERNRPILIGTHKFVNVGALRGKVKEIVNSRSDGESLKQDGTDYKLIRALLEYHPKGAEKTQGTIGIRVGKSAQGDSRCFYLIKEGVPDEDVSMKKCLDAIEANPPYVQVEKKAKEEAATTRAKAAEGSGAGEAKPAEAKAEEAKAPEGGEAKAEEAKAEEAKAA